MYYPLVVRCHYGGGSSKGHTKVSDHYSEGCEKESCIEIGDELRVVDKGEFIILRKRRKGKSLLELAGCWEGYPEEPDEFMKELRKLWSTWKV